MAFLAFLVIAFAVPKYSIKNLLLKEAEAAYRVDFSHLAVVTAGGQIQTYDDDGNLRETSRKLIGGDLLGFDSARIAIIGHEYAEYLKAVSISDGSSINFEGTPTWRTVFDRGTFLQTNGLILVASTEKHIAVVDDVGWHDMYCLSQDAQSLYLIRGDFQQAKLEKVRQLQNLNTFRHSKFKILRTPSHNNLHVIIPFTSALATLTETKLLAFCLLDEFTKSELEETPIVTVGDRNSDQKPSTGICEIDCETGIGHLLARLNDTTLYAEGPSFNTPMERRRDLAVFDSNHSFLVIFGGNAFLFGNP